MSVRICFVNKDGWKLKTESLVDVFWLFFYIQRPEEFDIKKYISLYLIKEISGWRLRINPNFI